MALVINVLIDFFISSSLEDTTALDRSMNPKTIKAIGIIILAAKNTQPKAVNTPNTLVF